MAAARSILRATQATGIRGATALLESARSSYRTAQTTGTRGATALLGALLVACAYAAFAHGAVGFPEETRLQLGLCALALWAVAAWVGGTALRPAATPLAWWAVGLLVALGAWSALGLLWSVQPDRTWQATNRTLAYTLVVVLALAAGTHTPKAIERFAIGWLAVAATVATYALGGKLDPGVSVPGLFDLNHTATVARLRAPLEYWNALGLVCVLAVPVALRVATDLTRSRVARLIGLGLLFEFLIVLGMTYSRGALLALGATLVVVTALGGGRLRGLAALVLAAVCAAPVLAAAFRLDGLTINGAPLDARIDDGRTLTAVLLACVAALLVAGWYALREEERMPWTPEHSRIVWRALAVVAVGFALIGVAGLANSERGVGGTVSDFVDDFTEVQKDEQFDPVRLASTNSGNRWVWWQEAVGGWSDRPVAGWGAGAFPLVHKRYRTDDIPVLQPHNVPLQFLVETGLVGFLLALGGLGALGGAAAARVRRLPAGRERDLGVALLAGGVAWTLHGIFDWDWDIPGVTIPVLAALGVLAARPGRDARRPREPFRDVEREAGGDAPARAPVLVIASLALALLAVSVSLPAWSDSKASDAQVTEDLGQAAAEAELAARLDPTAVRPLIVASAIAEGRGSLIDARDALLRAIDRQPQNPDLWFQLAGIAFQLADRDGFRDASRRALELDPSNGTVRALALRAEQFLTPPSASATAVGTPLPLQPLPPG